MVVSIVIPTRDRLESLGQCLRRLAPTAQTWRGAYEVVVTDDSPAETARNFLAEHFSWVKWIRGPRRGPASNRNNGARVAGGEWIIFTDDDCLPQPRWLEAILDRAMKGGVEVIEGQTVCPDKKDCPLVEEVENLRGGVYWSCNLAVRREAFERLGGFDESFREAGGEDMEFAWRIQQAGLATAFLPQAKVEHPRRDISPRQLWRRALMVRWISLYHLRTNQSPPLRASAFHVGLWLLSSRSLNLLRTTRQALRSVSSERWKRPLFLTLWSWVIFPVLLPYVMYWEFKFRSELKKGSGPNLPLQPAACHPNGLS